MKYLLSSFILLFFAVGTVSAQDDAITRYFDKYMDNEDFTVVYLSPKLFQLLGKLKLEDIQDEDAEAVLEVVEDLKSLRVLTSEVNGNQYYKEAVDIINKKDYEVLMTVRDDQENVQFLIKDDGGSIINELLLLVGGEDEFVMVSFVGNIDLDKISQLAQKLDVDGVEHLDKLDDRERN